MVSTFSLISSGEISTSEKSASKRLTSLSHKLLLSSSLFMSVGVFFFYMLSFFICCTCFLV